MYGTRYRMLLLTKNSRYTQKYKITIYTGTTADKELKYKQGYFSMSNVKCFSPDQ